MIDLTLNWMGMGVHDFDAAYNFYAQLLGINNHQNPAHGKWAYFETKGMTFELFQADPGRPVVDKWGIGQGYRPSILVNDLAQTIATLIAKGVTLSEVSKTPMGPLVEMEAPDGIRWSLCQAEGFPATQEWAHPYIGWVEVKTANVAAQYHFFTAVMGLQLEQEHDNFIHLRQNSHDARLILQPGGVKVITPPRGDRSPAFYHPVWISFATSDINAAQAHLLEYNVNILEGLKHHPSWNGTDMIIADADGNAVQVVQYG
jgi:predicted enzyme related to lactoylglutathione lyase